MIYLDSCVLIYLVQRDPVLAAPIAQAMYARPDDLYAISPLVEMECLVGAFKQNSAELEAAFRAVMRSCLSLAVPREAFHDAARLRAQYNLKTPDALHLAIARRGRCTALWTNDDRLSQAAPGYTVNVRSFPPATQDDEAAEGTTHRSNASSVTPPWAIMSA